MKAIYLNLDDAVRAVCAGRKVVRSILPLSVTIPAGQAAAVFAQTGTAAKTDDAGSAVTAIAWTFSSSLGDAIATGVAPGMSQVLASETASVYAVAGGSFTATATIKNSDTTLATVAITVIVNREQADGPVDLVDFTPPASGGTPSAADIKSALVAAGPGALEGVSMDGVRLVFKNENNHGTMIGYYTPNGEFGEQGPLVIGDDIQTAVGIGSNS